jgi:hypothetical protein
MKPLLTVLATALCLAATQAPAKTVTFDDYTSLDRKTLGHSYGGFTWTNFTVQKNVPYLANSGFDNGVTSGDYTAYNTGARMGTIQAGKNFELKSFSLTSAWRTGLNVLLKGYDNGNLIFSQLFVVNTTGPLLAVLNWKGIDKLTFTSSGGTNAGLGTTSRTFALDTLEVAPVPLPATAPLALMGFAALGAVARRRRRNA